MNMGGPKKDLVSKNHLFRAGVLGDCFGTSETACLANSPGNNRRTAV